MFSNSSSPTQRPFLEKYEFIIPIMLFVIFLAFTLPGISWGAPDTWHPDEIVIRSINALHGEWIFDKTNFDYPTLPQYVMLGLGRILLDLGKSDWSVLVASRILSAILAGLTIILTYIIIRRTGGSIYVSGLGGILLLCVSEMVHNGHFAHNDTYVTFFALLTVFCLGEYGKSKKWIWLYAAFILTGMSASCKYNGISLFIVPVLLTLFSQRHALRNNFLRILGTLSLGAALTYLGFAIGTPTALLRPVYYFGNMIPALLHTGNYARQPDTVRGVLGQYGVLADGLGLPLFFLFAVSLCWVIYKMIRAWRLKSDDAAIKTMSIFLLCMFALDLPIMLSYNYQVRFFLSMMPIFAIFGAFCASDFYGLLNQEKKLRRQILVTLLLVFVIFFSLARNISVMLLFLNDTRFQAGEYLRSLPFRSSLEYTYYPPTIPGKHFIREYNYPVYFMKVAGDPLPTSPKYEFNVGEAGLDDRLTDFLVIDSFTWKKFDSPYTCASMQIECDFFKQLGTGASRNYRLIADFSYSLPRYLPQIEIAFVNPEIRIYERIK